MKKFLALVVLAFIAALFAWWRQQPVLRDVGPRRVSNQTSQPLALSGEHFSAPLTVHLGEPFNRNFVAKVVDAHHAYMRLPADLLLPGDADSQEVALSIGRSKVSLVLVNDAAFVDLRALASDGKKAFALSLTTDTLYTIDLGSRAVAATRVGDGPSAIAVWRGDKLVIAHFYTPELWILSGGETRRIPAPRGATNVLVDNDAAYVTGEIDDDVWKIDLVSGAVSWKKKVGPNPRALAVSGDILSIGSLQSGEVGDYKTQDGTLLNTVVPGPNASIIGGRTEKARAFVMNAKADRAFVAAMGRVFATTIGPNIGPNAQRTEVSMNSGISVFDPASGTFERHFGLGFGVDEGLVCDGKFLYAADIATGQVHVFDAAMLLHDDTAREAHIGSVQILPPADFPLVRKAEDFGVKGRSGVEVHSGPVALALAGDAVLVLDRFTGTLAVIDRKTLTLREQIPVAETRNQLPRRQGEILYFADIGRTSRSCDACHLEGHTEGVFFTKAHPLRIYRAPTLRGTRDTPPYFVPPNQPSLESTSSFVGDRNRFFNPKLSPDEVTWLGHYSGLITNLPNPFVDADGAPPEEVALPDKGTGHTRHGMQLFDAQCASCHPPPLFAVDQDEKTRGKLFDISTPRVLGLRPQLQDRYFVGFPPPSLLGAWDVFPMFNTGAAGLRVANDNRLLASGHPAIREVLTTFATAKHGGLSGMSGADIDDLYAYILTL